MVKCRHGVTIFHHFIVVTLRNVSDPSRVPLVRHLLGVRTRLQSIGPILHNASMLVTESLRGATTSPWQLVATRLHVRGHLMKMIFRATRYGATRFPLHLAITHHHVRALVMKAQIGVTMYPLRLVVMYLHVKELGEITPGGVKTYQQCPEVMCLHAQERRALSNISPLGV